MSEAEDIVEMDEEMVDLVDEVLKFAPTGDEANPFKDGRESVMTLLKSGAEIRKFGEAVDLVCRRFCIRPLALLDWFFAKCENNGGADG